MITKAMIFAAGFGTRMKALTADCPKPLLTVGSITLLDHVISLARDCGIKQIVINAHYQHQKITRHVNAQPDIKVSVETSDILETGGGLKNALPLLGDEPILTLNSDLLFPDENPLQNLIENWNPNKMDALLLLIDRQNALQHHGQGDFDLKHPIAPIKRCSGSSASHVFTGAQIINPAALHNIAEQNFSISKLWDIYTQHDRVWGMNMSGRWVDVGHPEGLQYAQQLMA